MIFRKLIPLAVVILASSAFNLKAQKTYEVHKTFSGSSAPIAMDTNDDGLPAMRIIGGGPVGPVPTPYRSRFFNQRNPVAGEFTGDFISEGKIVEEPTGKCSFGEFELEVIFYSSVVRFPDGDILVSELIEGYTCFNPLTRRGHGAVRVKYTGGTGRFEGATGEGMRMVNFRALDSSGLRALFFGEETGTLSLPD